MKKHSFIALTLSVSLSNVCYGDARSEIIIENNRSVPIFLMFYVEIVQVK